MMCAWKPLLALLPPGIRQELTKQDEQTFAMLDGLVDRIEEELGHSFTILATGGMAQFVTPLCRHPMILEKNLLLRGLNILYKKNKRT